jgi:hypothetical protein
MFDLFGFDSSRRLRERREELRMQAQIQADAEFNMLRAEDLLAHALAFGTPKEKSLARIRYRDAVRMAHRTALGPF